MKHGIASRIFKIFGILSIVFIVGIGFAACSRTSGAKTAGNDTLLTTNRTTEIVNSIEKISDANFMFPAAFDDGFGDKEIIKLHKRIRTREGKYAAYTRDLDDLYLLCAELSEKNATANEKINTLRKLNTTAKKYASEIKSAKINNLQEVYSGIGTQSKIVREHINRLYASRNAISNQTKKFAKSDSINIKNLRTRYERISKTLDFRHEILNEAIAAYEKLNSKMCDALGIDNSAPEQEPAIETVGGNIVDNGFKYFVFRF